MRQIRSIALTVAGVLVAVACGADEPDAGVADATVQKTAPATTTTVDIDDVDDVDSITAVVEAGFGETENPFEVLRPITGFPEGLPVPPDAVVTEMTFNATNGDPEQVDARVQVWTPAAPEDVATLYRTAMPALGFDLTGGDDPEQGDGTQSMQFSGQDGSAILMYLVDMEAAVAKGNNTSPTTGTGLTVEYRPATSESVDRLGRWAADLPVDVRSVEAVGIWTGLYEPREGLQVSATVRVAGSPEDIVEAIKATLSDVTPLHPDYPFDENDIGVVGVSAAGRRTSYIAEPIGGDDGFSQVTVATCVSMRLVTEDRRGMAPWMYRGSCEEDASMVAGPTYEEPQEAPAERTPVTGAPATVAELIAATRDVLGPTDDVVADLAAFATLPDDLPTPTRLEIDKFDVHFYPGYPRYSPHVIVDARAPGSIADLATFFEARLSAAGYHHMGTTIHNEGESSEQRDILFSVEDAGVDDVPEIGIHVGNMYGYFALTEPLPGTPITYSIDGLVGQGRLAGHAWALPLPGIDADAVWSWDIAASAEPTLTTERQEMQLTATYEVADPAATIAAIRADPPDGATVRVDSSEADDVWLDRPGYDSFWVQPIQSSLVDITGVDVVGFVPFDL